MEQVSKLSHDPHSPPKSPQQHYPNLPILQTLKFVAILCLAFTESLIILLKYPASYHIIPIICITLYVARQFFISRHPEIFLVDFSCYKPPSTCRVPFSTFVEHASLMKNFDKENVEFMSKILHSSGQGQETYLPPALHLLPPKPTHSNSLDEAKMVLFPIMEDLLIKCNLRPNEINILIINCSGFCPSPCLCSLVINKFKLHPNIKAFNISGMGCSASIIALSLAQNMLSIYKDSNAVILSTEILTTGWYPGNEKPKLPLNCVFRMGAAAILLTNKRRAQNISKYKVVWTSRTLRSYDDAAYISAFREEDSKGLTGVTLNKNIVEEGANLIRAQVTALGSCMLPISEKVMYLASILKKKYLNIKCEIYVPNFKTVIKHFCLPVSGRPLIREIGKGLLLKEVDMEATLSTLHRFGNQSSSSLWYVLAYIEAKNRVQKGDKVCMLGMGSGPKCNTTVLECLRPIVGESKKGPWADCISRYPLAAYSSH